MSAKVYISQASDPLMDFKGTSTSLLLGVTIFLSVMDDATGRPLDFKGKIVITASNSNIEFSTDEQRSNSSKNIVLDAVGSPQPVYISCNYPGYNYGESFEIMASLEDNEGNVIGRNKINTLMLSDDMSIPPDVRDYGWSLVNFPNGLSSVTGTRLPFILSAFRNKYPSAGNILKCTVSGSADADIYYESDNGYVLAGKEYNYIFDGDLVAQVLYLQGNTKGIVNLNIEYLPAIQAVNNSHTTNNIGFYTVGNYNLNQENSLNAQFIMDIVNNYS